jgi:hypothetical protein
MILSQPHFDAHKAEAVRTNLRQYYYDFPSSQLHFASLRYPYEAEAMVVTWYIHIDMYDCLSH